MESQGAAVARLARMLYDEHWSEWLPIYAWIIEHDEGLILVDTGETSRFTRGAIIPHGTRSVGARCVSLSIRTKRSARRLKALGIANRDIRQVVLTHLHTDHSGGLMHLTGTKVWVSGQEWRRASGGGGRVLGYVAHRLPRWLHPEFISFQDVPLGPFSRSMSLSKRGDVVVIPTPGHTPHHVSVVVLGSPSYFIAGDTSYGQDLLLAGKVDGVSPDQSVSRDALDRIKTLATERPLVYLPSHDPGSSERLARNSVLGEDAEKKASLASIFGTPRLSSIEEGAAAK